MKYRSCENPVYEAMRQESRDALRYLTEMDYHTSCGHTYSQSGVCRLCGDDEPRKDNDGGA